LTRLSDNLLKLEHRAGLKRWVHQLWKLATSNTALHSEVRTKPWRSSSGVPRASRARGQSQFWRPHPDLSRQVRCEKRVGS